MGNWSINITGVGPHHNDRNESDVDVLMAEMLKTLREKGHIVTSGWFTYGGGEDHGCLKADKLAERMRK